MMGMVLPLFEALYSCARRIKAWLLPTPKIMCQFVKYITVASADREKTRIQPPQFATSALAISAKACRVFRIGGAQLEPGCVPWITAQVKLGHRSVNA
jgi:hypothetical protein